VPSVHNYVSLSSMCMAMTWRHEEFVSRLLLYHLATKDRISGAHECNWGGKEAIYGRNDVLLLVGFLRLGECDLVLLVPDSVSG
jgi:hypothetical protein